jgi:hypothetical protein
MCYKKGRKVRWVRSDGSLFVAAYPSIFSYLYRSVFIYCTLYRSVFIYCILCHIQEEEHGSSYKGADTEQLLQECVRGREQMLGEAVIDTS